MRSRLSTGIHGLPRMETLFTILGPSTPANRRNYTSLASGKPQKGATAARKACLLKNPAARKKAANLPALVAASPCPSSRARARRSYDRVADIPGAALRCCAPRRDHRRAARAGPTHNHDHAGLAPSPALRARTSSRDAADAPAPAIKTPQRREHRTTRTKQ